MQGAAGSSAVGAAKPPSSEIEQNFHCPRCESANTKFCYYNNYNLSQPRHFCKDCRRYWTRGGALRNVPVGGGTRKNSKRASEAAASTTAVTPACASTAGAGLKRLPPSTSAGDVQKPELYPFPFPPVEEDHRLLDFGGSFSSMLSSTSHFGNFLDEDSAATAPASVENFLGLPVDSSSWGGGWPDLTIYTPGTNFYSEKVD